MQEFLRKCQYAIALNRNILEEPLQAPTAFTAMIEKNFKEMKLVITAYLEEANTTIESIYGEF